MLKLLAEIHPHYCPSSTIYNWVCQRTGLQVVLVLKQSPVVNGYFAVATEINDDSGCPHTLEHLIFMGSKKYPYKGFLDILGSKQLSTTNAWTGQDQTVYTLSTAGWQGFSTMLPIYLDHILHATLEDSACVTEVYHIDGEGQESGVVFSEMQGVENTSWSLIAEASQRNIYPKGSGYAVNTGGLMNSLRQLKNEQIRAYHRKCYNPGNLAIIVTGSVDPNELVNVIESIVEDWDATAPGKRPFVESLVQPSPLKETIERTVQFPEKDQSQGEALISWIGPLATDDLENTALHVLGTYYTTAGVGKMQVQLVNVKDPFATEVFFYTDDYFRTTVNIGLSGVPIDKLGLVGNAVMDIIEQECHSPDIELLKECVERRRNKFVLDVENNSESFAHIAIDNFLYGEKNGSSLVQWLSTLDDYDTLKSWDSVQWSSFMKNTLIDNCHAVILGEPSRSLYLQLKEAKKSRLEEIRKTKDFSKLKAELEKAKAINDQPIPEEVLARFASPDLSLIRFIETRSAATQCADAGLQVIDLETQSTIDADTPHDFPLSINFESYRSQFVAVKVYLSSDCVDADLLPYIDVLLSELYSMPMKLDDGTELTADEVSQAVKRDTVVNSISPNAMLHEYVMFDLRAKLEFYDKIIEWIKRAMCNVVFDNERLKIFVNKHLNSLVELKRDGSSVLTALLYKHVLLPSSLCRQSEGILTEDFFRECQDNMNRVQSDMQRLVSQLFTPKNLRILVFGDIEKLKCPVSAWSPLVDRLGGVQKSEPLAPVPRTAKWRSELGMMPKQEAHITVVPATESSFLSVVSTAPTDFNDLDIPALTLCCAYLEVTEGPMWVGVRGQGLAYGAHMFQQTDIGLLVCNFYRASNAARALPVVQKIVQDLSSGKTKFDPELIQGAKASLVNQVASHQGSYSSAITNKFVDNVLRGRGPDFVKRFIKDLQGLLEKDLLEVLNKYISRLFDPHTSAIFATCHQSQFQSIKTYLEEVGYDVDWSTIAAENDYCSTDMSSSPDSGDETSSTETD